MKTITGKIVDIDIKEDGAVYVKISYNGVPLGANNPSDQSFLEDKPSINQNEIQFKLIKASADSPSSLKASQNYSAIIGSDTNRIVSSEKFGNFIVGPTTFTANPDNIRIGGVFRLNGLLSSTMPSTIVTPIPTLIFDFPLQQAAQQASQLLAEYQAFIQDALQ